MIKQQIYLKTEQWEITAYYAVTHLDVSEVMHSLEQAGCRGENLETAYQNLSAANKNTGLCYTGQGKSVLVISVTTSKPQFINSLAHELHHLSTQIAEYIGYNLLGEEVCYLTGEIAEKMYPIVSHYLCEKCCK